MPDSNLITNPVNIDVKITEQIGRRNRLWVVQPSLTAFRGEVKPAPKNIVFVLDVSSSMATRIEKVKKAFTTLLNNLNENDTFSVITFNDSADIVIEHQAASPNNIQAAERTNIVANKSTNYGPAFDAAGRISVSPEGSNTTVIFVTDGEDMHANPVPELLDKFVATNKPLVIPIGICLTKPEHKKVLNDLSRLSGGSGNAIFVNDDSTSAYEDALGRAYKQIKGRSYTSAQIEITIKSKGSTYSTERELGYITYNDKTPAIVSVEFDSPTPPSSIKLCVTSDGVSLYAEHKIEADDYSLGEHRINCADINVPHFKYKDHRFLSWLGAVLPLVVGSSLLAYVAINVYTLPDLALWTCGALIENVVASLAGLFLFAKGAVDTSKKTIFLPTKEAEYVKTAGVAAGLGLGGQEEKKGAAPESKRPAPVRPSVPFTTRLAAYLPEARSVKKFLAGSGLIASAAGGGIGGFFAGKAISTVVDVSSINPTLFLGMCSVAGAVVLPLLAYCIWKKYNSAPTLSLVPRGQKSTACKNVTTFFAGSALLAGGGAAGYYLGEACSEAVASLTGINPSLFVKVCAGSGAVIMSLLGYGISRCYDARTERRAYI